MDFLVNIDNTITTLFDKAEKSIPSIVSKYYKNKKITPTNFNPEMKWIDKYTKELGKTLVRDVINMTNKELEAFAKELNISIPRIQFLREIKNNIYNLTTSMNSSVRSEITNYISMEMVTNNTKLDIIKLSGRIEKSLSKTQIVIKETNSRLTRKFIDDQHKKLEKSLNPKYLYLGPVDKRISPFCGKYVGESKTRKQWEAIKSDIFIMGGHVGCRHYFVVDIDSLEKK